MKWYIFSRHKMDKRFPEGFLLIKNRKFYIPKEKMDLLLHESGLSKNDNGKMAEAIKMLHLIKDGSTYYFSSFIGYMLDSNSYYTIDYFIEFIRKAQETPELNAFCICDEKGFVYEPMDWLKEQGLIKEETVTIDLSKQKSSLKVVDKKEEWLNGKIAEVITDDIKAKIDLYAKIVLQELPAKYDDKFKLIILHRAVYLLTYKIEKDAEVPFDVLKDAKDTERLLNEPF